jgi:preprotein translocase subunit SecY
LLLNGGKPTISFITIIFIIIITIGIIFIVVFCEKMKNRSMTSNAREWHFCKNERNRQRVALSVIN